MPTVHLPSRAFVTVDGLEDEELDEGLVGGWAGGCSSSFFFVFLSFLLFFVFFLFFLPLVFLFLMEGADG